MNSYARTGRHNDLITINCTFEGFDESTQTKSDRFSAGTYQVCTASHLCFSTGNFVVQVKVRTPKSFFRESMSKLRPSLCIALTVRVAMQRA